MTRRTFVSSRTSLKKLLNYYLIETKAKISRQLKIRPGEISLPHPLHLGRIRRESCYTVRPRNHQIPFVGADTGAPSARFSVGPRQYNFVIGSPANYLLGRGSRSSIGNGAQVRRSIDVARVRQVGPY